MDYRAQFLLLVQEFVAVPYRPLLLSSATHEPKYHQFSFVEHCHRVIGAAERLAELTGIDVIEEAMLHDAGKLIQINREGGWHSGMFEGHEAISADIAAGRGLLPDACLIIRHHSVSYQYRVDRVLPVICHGDRDVLMRLLILAAADTAGKGWTETQRIQRPGVAGKFREICRLAGVNTQLSDLLADAILTW